MVSPTDQTSAIRAAFLDRDGTIIEEKHYLADPNQVHLLPGAVEGMRALGKKGFLIFVVSNQAGLGRGYISKAQFEEVQAEFAAQLKTSGIAIEDYFYCPHAPTDNCPCRKPKTGIIPKEWKGKKIDFAHSIVAGDKLSDLNLGIALGAKTFLVTTGYGEETKKTVPHSLHVTVVSGLLELSQKV